MEHPPRTWTDEAGIDEAGAESFPASDAPAWSPTHAGAPALRPSPVEPPHEAVRTALRADLDRLARVDVDVAGPERAARRRAREDVVARAMLDAGRAIVRESIDDQLRVRTVEAEQLGAERDAPCVVIGARYDRDDVSGAAMFLAMMRALAPSRMTLGVRFVALADLPGLPPRAASGSARYAARLASAGAAVHAMLSLGRLGFARDREALVVFTSNARSRPLTSAARDAFLHASRVPARALALPRWVPGVGRSDHGPFLDRGWPAAMVTDAPPWKARRAAPPDVDRMAAALPGLLAVVVRLADRRA